MAHAIAGCGFECKGGSSLCGDRCVDLERDPSNCGACKNACLPGELCSVGVCGLCTVLVDGKMVASCLNLAALVDGQEITTIEGIAEDDRLHPVQQAFIDYGGFQCGICTPGQIIAAKALLDENPEPSEEEVREWMMGSLCRCTGYYKILESVVNALGKRK